jgi:hypothetical protein
MYESIRKDDMTIDELYKKILWIGRQANYRPKELYRSNEKKLEFYSF